MPRFRLRSLLIFAVAFCLLFGWIGKGLYRVRQEDAAIETILRAHGGLYTEPGRGLYGAPGALLKPSELPTVDRVGDLLLRSLGWRQRPAVAKIELRLFDDGGPSADEAMAAAARFPEVRSVSLMGPAFDDASLPTLDRLPKLEELYLVHTRVTAEGMSNIAAPERLRYLHVQGQGLRANALAAAGRFRGLREADVINCLITREEVAALASLPELERLDLSEVQLVGDDVLGPLAEAHNLRSLEFWIARRPPSRDELQAIAAAPALERLEIALNEAGLPLFVGAERLRFLGPYLAISEEASRAFSIEHSECVIRVRRSNDSSLYLRNGEPVERPASETHD